MRRFLAIAVMVIAWVVIIVSAFIFVDGFLPSRSQGPSISLPMIAMGAVGCTIGFGLRWASKAITGAREGLKENRDVSEQSPESYFRKFNKTS